MRRQLRLSHAVRAFAAALILVSCCWTGFSRTAGAQEPGPMLHPASSLNDQGIDLAKLFDAVVGTIDQKFFDVALMKQADWQARAKTVRPSVLSAATTQDAVRQINALLSELKTSHTQLFTPDEYDYYTILDVIGGGPDVANLLSRRYWGSGPYFPGTGAFTREVDGHHFIDGILEGSPAERAGLRYGDEILAVDGMPYSPIAVFRGKAGSTAELSIRRAAGTDPQHLDVPVVPIRPTTAFSAATEASARVIERNGSRAGYIHIWASSESNSFRNAMSNLGRSNVQPLDFLIVDMRGRVGGNSAVAGQFLDQLVKPYWGHWQTIGRPGSPWQANGQPPPFRGGSALLIDQHTRSAAEVMAYGYQRSRLGTVIGTPSAGAVSSGALVVMPGDLLFYVAVFGHEFDGRRLEGVGVVPDHRVERPLTYAAGADPVLDAAVDLLSKPAPQ